MPKIRVKSNIIVVALESVITGHRAFQCRPRTDPKLERILYDPCLNRKVLFKEVERLGTKTVPDIVKRSWNLA